jgi:predicted nucleic acid-binding Zn ribbon protein
MEKTGELLGKVVRKMGQPQAALAWLASAWPRIVGEKLAARTRPVRCLGGVLEVLADGKDWRNQLDEMKGEFCRRINNSWGMQLVSEIRFVAAKPGPRWVRREADNEHTPFVRTKRGHSK